MSSELEARLRRLFAGATSTGDVEERALRRALGALPAPDRAHHRRRALTLAVAATLGVTILTAGAFAAAGALHVSLGRTPATSATASSSSAARLVLQPGMHGVAAVIDGRLWLTTQNGMRIEGLPVSSAELSPHARYVGAGMGHTLVVMAPDGQRAWVHPAHGDVVSIAWAPNGLVIAYVVRTHTGFQLRLIEGDGDHDRLLDPAVRPTRPSWRADTLALAYVGAGGHAIVYDLAHRSREAPKIATAASAVSFAPTGATLAVTAARGVWIVAGRKQPRLAATTAGPPAGLAWTRRSIAVAVNPASGRPYVQLVGRGGTRVAVGARILALTSSGDRIAVAVGGARPELQLLAETPSHGQRLLILSRAAKITYFVAR